jgi:sulfur carrier protein
MMTTIRLNGETEQLAATTIAELVAAKSDMPAGRGLAVALNGSLVRRADWANTRLKAGDAVEIVRAMQGG